MTRSFPSAQPDPPASPVRLDVIGAPIHALCVGEALRTIEHWAASGTGRYVCFSNVHSVVTAGRDPGFHRALQQADLALPDGAPVAWMMRRAGAIEQRRVCGPDLMLDLCERASRSALPIYLYGSTEATLAQLRRALCARWPSLVIAGAHAPPFRPSTVEEDDEDVRRIRESGARLVFVSLGCPKQELWMAAHRDRLDAVLLGVGAAFDFHAGRIPRAPARWRRLGLEWAHRLLQEPRRLGMRYLGTNSVFIARAARQLLGRRFGAWRHG